MQTKCFLKKNQNFYYFNIKNIIAIFNVIKNGTMSTYIIINCIRYIMFYRYKNNYFRIKDNIVNEIVFCLRSSF